MRCAEASIRLARRRRSPNASRQGRRNAHGPSVVLATMYMRRHTCALGLWVVLSFALLAAAPRQAFAQADEIQVYDGGLADTGKFNLTWHNNFTPKGITTPAFPGAVV